MKKESYVNYEEIEGFLNDLIIPKEEIFSFMEIYAKENYVPIIKQDVVEYLKVHLMIQNPFDIIEIGTAIGYSSLQMAHTLKGNCQIDTLEVNPEIIHLAEKNICRLGYKDSIRIIEGDAVKTLPDLDKYYDLAFIDASKGQYREFWDLILPKIRSGGVVICDNILIRGLVCKPINEIPRKHRAHSRKMKDFIEYIFSQDKVKSILLPLGDGLLISYVK